MAVGVIVYVTVPATLFRLVIVCAGISPVPLAVNPVMPFVPVAVQLNVVPLTLLVSGAMMVLAPLHIVCEVGSITFGSGSTVIS